MLREGWYVENKGRYPLQHIGGFCGWIFFAVGYFVLQICAKFPILFKLLCKKKSCGNLAKLLGV